MIFFENNSQKELIDQSFKEIEKKFNKKMNKRNVDISSENILKIDSFHDNQNKNLYNKSFNLHPEIKKTNQKDKKEIESTNNNLNLNNSETIETVQAIDNFNELLDLDNQLNIDYNSENDLNIFLYMQY